MKSNGVLRSLLVICLTLFMMTLAWGADNVEDEKALKVYRSEEVEGFVLQAWFSSPQPYVMGEPIFLTVEVKNVSKENKQFPRPTPNPLQNLKVKVIGRKAPYPPEREIGYTRYGTQKDYATRWGGGSLIPHVLVPGDSIKYRLWLSRLFDLSRRGKYEVEVGRPILGAEGERKQMMISAIELIIEEPDAATLRRYQGRLRQIELSDEETRLLKAFNDKRRQGHLISNAEALEVAELIISKRFSDIHVTEHLGKFESYSLGSLVGRLNSRNS